MNVPGDHHHGRVGRRQDGGGQTDPPVHRGRVLVGSADAVVADAQLGNAPPAAAARQPAARGLRQRQDAPQRQRLSIRKRPEFTGFS